MMLRELFCCITIFALSVNVTSRGDEFPESKSLLTFIQSVDPENNLRYKGLESNPCLSRFKGIKCLKKSNSVTEVSLNKMNLSGIIDTNALCNLPNLRVVNLAENHIQGNIPATVSRCSNLRYLNLSRNLLNGSVPVALYKLKNLKILDISNNLVTWESNVIKDTVVPSLQQAHNEVKPQLIAQNDTAPAPATNSTHQAKRTNHNDVLWMELGLAMALFGLLALIVYLRTAKSLKQKRKIKDTIQSSPKGSIITSLRETKKEEQHQELVFFVEEEDQFKLENLLDAGADMQNQNYCSSLYKVQLSNNVAYAVKRLKKLQVSYDDFNRTMAMVGKLNHPNLLPLVAYSCQTEEKLLIYKYQNKGSLLSLMERYIEGKRDFQWKLRLSIAVGIARGLDYIYRSFQGSEVIPHGNIKLSNILLGENLEPLISEYGYSNLLDPKSACLFRSNGYTAPEKALSEQGDVFSFGVILLELLTGKIVENSGLDLPKWVKAMVREEWTGEVFDKEIAKVGMYAFPLLNVALKCVAHFAENRPSMAEVLETIVGVVDEDLSCSSSESSPQDGHVLYTVAEEG
uniref:probably inactive receptor-like protein kinase At5g41680 n=1 Tax=Erigeron canadensis TaxID=72917 RepID=UPI001CB93923|nr:probably inactive receptor-like protein kinase At5g41680 [Erigeron canadensis]